VLVLIILLGLSLVACGGSSNNLDFISVRDTETGAVFSIGDSRSVFEEALGEGVAQRPNTSLGHEGEVNTWERYQYAFGNLDVEFLNDRAVLITAHSERFVFAEMSFDMTLDEVRTQFPLFSGEYANMVYYRYSDASGNVTTEWAEVEYEITIHVKNGAITGLSILWVSEVRSAWPEL